jgi:hypothetical protein
MRRLAAASSGSLGKVTFIRRMLSLCAGSRRGAFGVENCHAAAGSAVFSSIDRNYASLNMIPLIYFSMCGQNVTVFGLILVNSLFNT